LVISDQVGAAPARGDRIRADCNTSRRSDECQETGCTRQVSRRFFSAAGARGMAGESVVIPNTLQPMAVGHAGPCQAERVG
jgi:hypothetical protein